MATRLHFSRNVLVTNHSLLSYANDMGLADARVKWKLKEGEAGGNGIMKNGLV
jgi:hypothetical protein